MKQNENESKQYKEILFAILAAALYAISTPVYYPFLMAPFLFYWHVYAGNLKIIVLENFL